MGRVRGLELLVRVEKKRERVKIGVVIVSGVLVVLLMVAVAHYYGQQAENKKVTVKLSDLTETLIKKNSTLFVNPGSATVYKETLSYNSTLDGAFSSDKFVTFYVFDQMELLAQNSSEFPSYIYTTGETMSASISASLSPGVYYLEFLNGNTSSVATVQIRESFTISFTQ